MSWVGLHEDDEGPDISFFCSVDVLAEFVLVRIGEFSTRVPFADEMQALTAAQLVAWVYEAYGRSSGAVIVEEPL